MKKLEKLSAMCQKISTAEQAFLFGGEKTTGSFCFTATCKDGHEDMRNDRYDEDGKQIATSTTIYNIECG